MENVFGTDVFPAKSGKEENSMEYDTNDSRGTPAPEGAAAATGTTGDCRGGRGCTAAAVQIDARLNNVQTERGAILAATTDEVMLLPFVADLAGHQLLNRRDSEMPRNVILR